MSAPSQAALLDLQLVRPGDALPGWIIAVVGAWFSEPREEARCPVCGGGLGLGPGAFSLCTDGDEPTAGIVSGIYRRCARLSDSDLLEALVRAIERSGIFSGLRR